MIKWDKETHIIGVPHIDYQHQKLHTKMANFLQEIQKIKTSEECTKSCAYLIKYFTYHLQLEDYLYQHKEHTTFNIQKKFNKVIQFKLNLLEQNIKENKIVDEFFKYEIKNVINELFLEHIGYNKFIIDKLIKEHLY